MRDSMPPVSTFVLDAFFVSIIGGLIHADNVFSQSRTAQDGEQQLELAKPARGEMPASICSGKKQEDEEEGRRSSGLAVLLFLCLFAAAMVGKFL